MTNWRKVGMGENIDLKRDGIGTETVGIFLGTDENVGPNNSKVHNLRMDGKTVQFWGSTVLDARFDSIEKGNLVKIVYLGQEKSKTAGRAAFHNFDVFVADGEGSSETPETSGESNSDQDDLPF